MWFCQENSCLIKPIETLRLGLETLPHHHGPSRQGVAGVFLKPLGLRHRPIPTVQVQEFRPLNGQVEPPVSDQGQGNIGQTHVFTGNECRPTQCSVQDLEHVDHLHSAGLQLHGIASLFRLSNPSPKQHPHRGPSGRIGPIQPLVNLGPLVKVSSIPLTHGVVLKCQVTQNGVRLPENKSLVVERRHQAIGIHFKVLWRFVHPIGHARIDSVKIDVKLLAEKQNFLDIEGIQTPPDRAGGLRCVHVCCKKEFKKTNFNPMLG